MILPTIHINGTSRDELLRQLRDAASAVDAAYIAHGHCHPHPRDYYVQVGDAFTPAAAQWQDRADALKAVYDELIEMYHGIEELP